MVNKPGKDIEISRRMQKSTLLSPISLSSTQSQYGNTLSTVEIFHRQIFQTFFFIFQGQERQEGLANTGWRKSRKLENCLQ